MRLRELKQQLIDGSIVGFKNFSLIISSSENHGITEDVPLEDELLPLHLCGVSDNNTIRVIGHNVQTQLVTQRGKQWYKSVPRNITVNQMKQRIRPVNRFFTGKDRDLLQDVWLFVKHGKSYQRLDEDSLVGAVLSDNDVIYLVEDRFFHDSDVFPVYYKGQGGWSCWLEINIRIS